MVFFQTFPERTQRLIGVFYNTFLAFGMIARPQMDCTGTGNGLGVLSWQNSMVEYVASEKHSQEMFQPQMEDITMGAPQIRQFLGLSTAALGTADIRSAQLRRD